MVSSWRSVEICSDSVGTQELGILKLVHNLAGSMRELLAQSNIEFVNTAIKGIMDEIVLVARTSGVRCRKAKPPISFGGQSPAILSHRCLLISKPTGPLGWKLSSARSLGKPQDLECQSQSLKVIQSKLLANGIGSDAMRTMYRLHVFHTLRRLFTRRGENGETSIRVTCLDTKDVFVV